jgi:hypothetical protein
MFRSSLLLFLGFLQIVVFLAAAVKPAQAYVDPGSGLLAFQVGGSMLAGALFVLRSKIRKLFSRSGASKVESKVRDDAGTNTGLLG